MRQFLLTLLDRAENIYFSLVVWALAAKDAALVVAEKLVEDGSLPDEDDQYEADVRELSGNQGVMAEGEPELFVLRQKRNQALVTPVRE